MKREIREIVDGKICITCPDERWYARRVMRDTPQEKWDFVPSVTWICDVGMPKGIGFFKWLASKGWDDAEAIKAAAGDKGSKVHQAIGALIQGGTVSMEDMFANSSGELEELTPEEYACLMSFVDWCDEEKPQFIASEYTVWNEHYRYAGTVDIKARLKRDDYKSAWIIDIKTSADIWPSHVIQVSAYKHADGGKAKLAILQVGYRRNKIKKYKFTPIVDKFKLFLAARQMWADECENIQPLQREYPLTLSLAKQEVEA